MKTNRFLSAAIFGFALAFTFSCSSGGGDDPDNGGNGQGGSFNENSQVYNFDGRNIGTAYKGNGDIKIELIGNGDGKTLNAGSVTNGIVKLELPTTIPEEYLSNSYFCDANSPEDAKYTESRLNIYNNEKLIGGLIAAYLGNDYAYSIIFLHSTKAAKITCESERYKYDIDAKAGWNKVYLYLKKTEKNGEELQMSTNDFLKKAGELKWILFR